MPLTSSNSSNFPFSKPVLYFSSLCCLFQRSSYFKLPIVSLSPSPFSIFSHLTSDRIVHEGRSLSSAPFILPKTYCSSASTSFLLRPKCILQLHCSNSPASCTSHQIARFLRQDFIRNASGNSFFNRVLASRCTDRLIATTFLLHSDENIFFQGLFSDSFLANIQTMSRKRPSPDCNSSCQQ